MDRPLAAAHDAGNRGMRSVRVDLGRRSYDVLIGPGLIARAMPLIESHAGAARCAIVTDANVARLYLEGMEVRLRSAARHLGSVVLPPGEATKSFSELAPLCERLLAMGIERGDLVLALGGGVIGDLAGFAASMVRRGVRYVQLPTTLLAQVDSSVGGKTGINTPLGKNLVGAFHQPSLVLADTAALASLPVRELRAGYAEVVKYALIGDAPFYDWLEHNRSSLFAGDAEALGYAIERCVAMKAGIVQRDETEAGERALLNLGHTFGHALEAWAGYSDRLLHGEAVAVGICLAFRLAERLALCPPRTAARIAAHLAAAGLPTGMDALGPSRRPTAGRLVELMHQDKKVQAGRLTLVLARDIGQAFLTRDVDPASITEFLAAELGEPAAA